MRRLETKLDGPILLETKVNRDERGFLQETYRRNVFRELGIEDEFVQDNHSRSTRGVVRGMHFQVGTGQAKLMRCLRGAVFDVVVDLRKSSPTYGQWEAFDLDDQSLRQVYVPVGFAHGFCVTSDEADVVYKCSSYYAPSAERVLRYDDPDVGIRWPLDELIASERDARAPLLREIEGELPFS